MKPPHQLDEIRATKPSSDMKHRDFAVYVDGKRIAAELTVTSPDGIIVHGTFRTSVGALDGDGVNPLEEIAWAGWKPGDVAKLRQPTTGRTRFPVNGTVQIQRVVPPAREGDLAMFTVLALSPIYDYEADAEVCASGEYAAIPATWFQR